MANSCLQSLRSFIFVCNLNFSISASGSNVKIYVLINLYFLYYHRLSDNFIFHSHTERLQQTFLSKLLSLGFRQYLVRITFLQKWLHFRLVSLSQNSTICPLANGWWNTCFYHYYFLHNSFLFFLKALGLSESISLLLKWPFWWSSLIIYL